MTVELLRPILADRTRSINFFNGRLLTGDDLTTEQIANRVALGLLGQAIGDGVAYGLEVREAAQSSLIQSPVLAVTRGLAINRKGAALLLEADTEVELARPPETTNGGGQVSVFQDCQPTQTGTYIAGAGVYLLTVGPAAVTQGLAEVSGISTAQAPCNSKYNAQGVQFRLIQLDLSRSELADTNHLRNLVAYKCFGVTEQAAFVTDPFGPSLTSYGLMDQLRAQQSLTDCEVPLAVVYWTAASGIVFVDMWAVRRPVIPQATLADWAPLAGERRLAEGLAMFMQFQAQIGEMVEFGVGGISPNSIAAHDFFGYLPPVGLVPIGNIKGSLGFDYLQFFGGRTYNEPVFIEGSKTDHLISNSILFPPLDFSNEEMLWLYRVRENMRSVADSVFRGPQPFMIFTNGHMPYLGDAQYDLSYWEYANYAWCTGL